MKILDKILQNFTYTIYTQYESKDFLLTKSILNFFCHGNQNQNLKIMENYHKNDFLVIIFNTFQPPIVAIQSFPPLRDKKLTGVVTFSVRRVPFSALKYHAQLVQPTPYLKTSKKFQKKKKKKKKKKSNRKVQAVHNHRSPSLTPQEEEETDKSKQAQIEQTYEKHHD